MSWLFVAAAIYVSGYVVVYFVGKALNRKRT